ncbi:hypothetical protein, partial [Rhodococcus sp. 14C212]|uniref:hypothetical protein n=1 Tax=Rhodococcus sp. 14C212 TaxID=2711209 RepID=UPI00197EAD9D
MPLGSTGVLRRRAEIFDWCVVVRGVLADEPERHPTTALVRPPAHGTPTSPHLPRGPGAPPR